MIPLEKLRTLLRHPDIRIRALRSGFAETGNPAYVWQAVAICAEHSRPLPDWILAYLGVVAKLMTSDAARASTDLRAILPSIMGFPAKRGPGHPLDPDGGVPDDAALLSILFAIEIERGEKPSAALHNAASHSDLSPEVAAHDDRTLWRWVMQTVGLEQRPRTNDEWREVLRNHFVAFNDLIEQEFRETLR